LGEGAIFALVLQVGGARLEKSPKDVSIMFVTDAVYTIKTGVFEGPLDLLLSLIEQRKLFINDIALSQVADEYIAHVRRCEDFPIADTAQFILVASTLVLIKSKSLLPNLTLSEEEQSDIDDLEQRLKLYRQAKELSQHLRERFGKNHLFGKLPGKERVMIFSPGEEVSLPAIGSVMRMLLKNLPKKELPPQTVIKKVISLEEMIARLSERIQSSIRMSFHQFASIEKAEKIEIIVSFLAVLELVKQGALAVVQEAHFSDVYLESREVGVPQYH